MAHKVVPVKYYLINFGVITVLMLLTVYFGKFVDLSRNPNGINLAIALTIAILKASCIVAIFMGVAFSTTLVRTFAIGGFSWLTILFLFILTDYVNPSADWGTPYYDMASPGVSPLPGGQDHVRTGDEHALVQPGSGFEYVDPHAASGGHGADHGEASEDSHEAAPEEEHATPEH